VLLLASYRDIETHEIKKSGETAQQLHQNRECCGSALRGARGAWKRPGAASAPPNVAAEARQVAQAAQPALRSAGRSGAPRRRRARVPGRGEPPADGCSAVV